MLPESRFLDFARNDTLENIILLVFCHPEPVEGSLTPPEALSYLDKLEMTDRDSHYMLWQRQSNGYTSYTFLSVSARPARLNIFELLNFLSYSSFLQP